MKMDKAKMIELKPCPFCGGEAIIADAYGPYAIVSCKSCPCAVEVYGSMKYAVETWNRRVGDVLDELCEQCNDHLVQGDWTTVDGRKLCSLCAYYVYGEGK
jgi:Lar family restriction alleviation protein